MPLANDMQNILTRQLTSIKLVAEHEIDNFFDEIERIRGSSPVEEAIPFKKAPTEKMSRKQEIQLANATQTASIRSTSRQPFTS